jgi:hypothetical protein
LYCSVLLQIITRIFHRPCTQLRRCNKIHISETFVSSCYSNSYIFRPNWLPSSGIQVVKEFNEFSRLFPSSCIPKSTTFRKLDLFPSSGEGGEKTPTQLGPLERANLNLSIENTGRWKSPEKFCEFCTTYIVVRILSSPSCKGHCYPLVMMLHFAL